MPYTPFANTEQPVSCPCLPYAVLQAPVFILVLQLLFAAAVVKALAVWGAVQADALQWRLIRPFLPFVASFLGTIYANIKVLEHSNVETFITVRSSTPLVLSLCEFFMLGRELPRGQSVFGMVLPLVGVAGYTYYDQGFKLEAYAWLLVWYAFFLFDALYVKYMCDTVPMTNWGRVYYTIVISGVILLAVLPFCCHEHQVIQQFDLKSWQTALLLLSCFVGVGMSHATFLTRSSVSATAGVVIGVVCKLGSVLLNLGVWEHHGTPVQLFFLTIGLIGGSLFQQAPMRPNWQYKQHRLALKSKVSDDVLPDSADLEYSSPSSTQYSVPLGAVGSSTVLRDATAASTTALAGADAMAILRREPRDVAGLLAHADFANTKGNISAAQAGALADLQQLSVWMLGRTQWPGMPVAMGSR